VVENIRTGMLTSPNEIVPLQIGLMRLDVPVENPVETALNVADYERLAAETLQPGAYGYFAGGAGDEVTLRENVAAFQRLRLRPRVLADVSGVTTAATVLGHEVSMPILVAPVAFQRLAHPDGEVAAARAAARAGTIFCLSTVATSAPAEITEGVRWFQLYVFKDRGFTRSLVEGAAAAGFSAILLTADTPHLGRRERDHRTGFKIPAELVPSLSGHDLLTPEQTFASMADDLSWRDIEWLASISGLPVLVKGVLTAEDALLASESGAAGLVVSNHGGRQLDGVPATIEALPEVAEAVAGRIPVLMDGGIRRGTDVVKALALGAEAVLAGRPFLWGLAVGGEQGVAAVLELLRAELELALALLGCRSPAEVTGGHVSRR
jgi:isopentenyl diphosphate isomerase/L-lactate dehydrogenase-like FMN-dependent dehydrogenase